MEITTLQWTVDRVHEPINLPAPGIPGAGIVRGVALGLLMWLAAGVAWLAARWMGLA